MSVTENRGPDASGKSSAPLPVAPLGAGGSNVSRLALGTMTFGTETDEAESHRQLDLFAERGGTLIDTADVYGEGESERIVGRWLEARGRGDDFVIATKGRFAPPAGSPGASRRALKRSVARSLERLEVEAIDLYFIHGWDRDTPVRETLAALGELVAAGKIHDVGWSNVTGWQLQRILSVAEAEGFPRPVAMQPQYNLLDRGIEWELLPCCLEADVAVTPWSPLGGGWLTGKYSRDARPSGASRLGEDPDRGVEAYDLRNTARTWAVLEVVERIAGAHGRPMSHVALAWLLSRPGVASVLLGARTAAQLEDNLGAVGLELDEGELRELSEVSAPGLPPYPYAMIEEFCGVDVWRRLGTRRAAEAPTG